MLVILMKIMPILLIFMTGFILRKCKVFTQEHADIFLKLVFYVSLPALFILSIANVKLSLDFIFIPVSAAAIIFATFFIAKFSGGFYKLPAASFGAFLVAPMVMNIGFLYPFYLAVYGLEGMARASMFDFANSLLNVTFVYYYACKYGGSADSGGMLAKVAKSPSLWGLLIGLLLNITHASLPAAAVDFFQVLGDVTIPLVMLSLGIYFSPKLTKVHVALTAIVIRMFIGLLIGYIFVSIFNLGGLNKVIILISAAAPVGFTTLTFASMENLDKELAAGVVSYSVLIGIIMTPILIFLLA